MSQAICGILRLDGGPADPAEAVALADATVAPGLALGPVAAQRDRILKGQGPIGEGDLDPGVVERALDRGHDLVPRAADVDRA